MAVTILIYWGKRGRSNINKSFLSLEALVAGVEGRREFLQLCRDLGWIEVIGISAVAGQS